jgi:hypothetical protein
MPKFSFELIVQSGWLLLKILLILFAMNSGVTNFVYQNF